MADKVIIEAEVKSNIGEVSKDASNAASEFKIMGVSLNGVKAGFASAAVTAKGMFGSIKAGLISTGIGAFVVLIGSLVSYFTNTKRGAETLQRAMAGLGAVVDVLTDAFSELGGIIIDTFQDPMPALKTFGKGLLNFLRDPTGATRDMFIKATIAAKDFKDELVEETAAMIALTKASQELADNQRALNVETAQSIAFIEKQKLIAEDITKTYAEREEAANSAFKKETDLENKRIKLAVEAVRIETERHALKGKDSVMAEDLDALAELEINLANIRQESAGRQISLQNFLNSLRQTEAAEQDAIWEKKIADNDAWNEKQIADAKIVADAKIKEEERVAKAEEDLAKLVEDTKQKTIAMGFASAKGLAKEGSAAAKAIGVAETIYNTQAAIMQAMKLPPPYNMIQAGLTGVMGATAIAKIMSTNPTEGGGGGGGGASAAASSGAPAPQMMSGAFDLTGGVVPEATRAYVLTDEMTNSQNQLANIRRRATI